VGTGLIVTGVILFIVGITSPITFDLGPYGKLWWPDRPTADPQREKRAVRIITVMFSSVGIGLAILGVVLAARS
jgi:hypothetical protein